MCNQVGGLASSASRSPVNGRGVYTGRASPTGETVLVVVAIHIKGSRWFLAIVGVMVLATGVVAVRQLPAVGAGGLLHPSRRHVAIAPPAGCRSATYAGAGIQLQGWRCEAVAARRASLVYLHGVADNRASGAGVIERFVARGFDVVVDDSRAHGESEGKACTYGYFEKAGSPPRHRHSVAGPVVLAGTSLGAAVALQEAAEDSRVSAVVAAETFSDLRAIATERAPFFFTAGIIRHAFELAEQEAEFDVDAVSAVVAASRINAPVILIHGEAETETRSDHSRRVFDALRGQKRLILVPGAGHNGSLRAEVWTRSRGGLIP